MSDYQVLIDSDAFVGWILEDDTNHTLASDRFNRLIAERKRLVTTSFVVAETATVLSHLAGQETARMFLRNLVESHRFPMIFIEESLYSHALHLFKSQEKRGTSVTDCANVAVAREFEIPQILSFDAAYGRDFDLELVA
jgi:predicted nucleic acid-binding protein